MSNPRTRKSCAVPKCVNTTINAPEKLFFIVPFNLEMRKKWVQAMKREPLGIKSCVYCCEDHFDIENDMENYIKYKLVGGRIKLKNGVVPHKFECQQQKYHKPERPAVKKRNEINCLEKMLVNDTISSRSNACKEVSVACENKNIMEDPLALGNNDQCLAKLKHHKAVQVQFKNKVAHKSTITEEKYFRKKKKRTLNKKISKKKTATVRSFTDSFNIASTKKIYDPVHDSEISASNDT